MIACILYYSPKTKNSWICMHSLSLICKVQRVKDRSSTLHGRASMSYEARQPTPYMVFTYVRVEPPCQHYSMLVSRNCLDSTTSFIALQIIVQDFHLKFDLLSCTYKSNSQFFKRQQENRTWNSKNISMCVVLALNSWPRRQLLFRLLPI